MRIALHVDGPIIRGNEQQIIELAAGLRARGHEVYASCRAGGPVEQALRAHGVTTTGVRPRGDADIFSALRFASWLRRIRPDALLLTSWVRLPIGAWAAAVARTPRVVFRLGGLQPIGHRRRGRERRALAQRVDAIIANSEQVKDLVTSALPRVADRVHVVPNGIAPPPPDVAPAPLRAELGIPADAVLAVAVGGLEDNKGFDVLLRALSRVDDVHAILVGSGTPAQEAAMRAIAEEERVGARAHFVGRRHDIHAILAGCDLFVLASRSEGFGVARLEAMSMGLPVIATAVGGSAEAAEARAGRSAAGPVVPPGDPIALAAALRHAVDQLRRGDPAIATAAAEGQWRARNWFSIGRMVDGYEAVLAGESPS